MFWFARVVLSMGFIAVAGPAQAAIIQLSGPADFAGLQVFSNDFESGVGSNGQWVRIIG